MQNEALFRDKPVWRAILSLALPSVFSVLIMVLYNMADLFFIGQLGDTAQVAAVSVVGPVFSLLAAIATMLGAGGCAVISRALGAGQRSYAKTCASLVGWACLLAGVAAAVLFNVFCQPLLHFLGATPEMLGYAETYMRVLSFGSPLMLLSTGAAMLLRAEGAIRAGLLINLAGTAVNMLLDPLFILVLGLGVTGAAVATVLGNLVGTICFLVYVARKAEIAGLSPRAALAKPAALGSIMALGLPNAISSLLAGFASTFANQLLSGYGTGALAAYGAAGKVVMLTSLVQMGICMGAQPLMAYNCGAGNLPRLKEVLKKLALLTFGFGLTTTILCILLRTTLIGLFLQDSAAAATGGQMVVWLLLSGPLLGFYYMSSNFLQASGNATAATAVSVLRQGALLIPLLYLMEHFLGLSGISIAQATADILSAAAAAAISLCQLRKLQHTEELPITG